MAAVEGVEATWVRLDDDKWGICLAVHQRKLLECDLIGQEITVRTKPRPGQAQGRVSEQTVTGVARQIFRRKADGLFCVYLRVSERDDDPFVIRKRALDKRRAAKQAADDARRQERREESLWMSGKHPEQLRAQAQMRVVSAEYVELRAQVVEAQAKMRAEREPKLVHVHVAPTPETDDSWDEVLPEPESDQEPSDGQMWEMASARYR
jgi:hypothetical protein